MSINTNELDEETRKQLNRLAREEFKLKLYKELIYDVQICKLEGWNYKEYIEELIFILKEIENK